MRRKETHFWFLEVTKGLTLYSKKYNILLMRDSNMTPENRHLKDFTASNYFENLSKVPTWFNSSLPTAIDLFFRSRKCSFMISSTSKT